jgi:3-oxoacyl-[acyl-carrier-protein] synthase-3
VKVVTLDRVEAFTPRRSWTIDEVAEESGLSRHQARMFRRIRGMETVRSDPDLTLLDLLAAPAETLLATMSDVDIIRYLVYSHTFPDLTPSYVNAPEVLRDRLGLRKADAFAVAQQACASGLAAIDVAGELLRADGDPSAKALVLTGEKPFTGLTQYLVQVSIMGEASSACLVGLDGGGSRVISYANRTEGEFAAGFRMTPDTQRRFGESYNDYLLDQMESALSQAGLTMSDIAMVVPHNVNLSSWLKLCTRIGFDRRRVFLDNLAEFGHCYCSDPFLNLVSMREQNLLTKGELYMLTSVGVGSTYAAMVIEY